MRSWRSVVNGQVVDFLGARYVLYDPRECRIKRHEKLIFAKLQEAGARSATFFRDSIPFIREPRRISTYHRLYLRARNGADSRRRRLHFRVNAACRLKCVKLIALALSSFTSRDWHPSKFIYRLLARAESLRARRGELIFRNSRLCGVAQCRASKVSRAINARNAIIYFPSK